MILRSHEESLPNSVRPLVWRAASVAVVALSLLTTTVAKPDRIDVMTCSLDDPEVFPPQFHVWASDRLAWDQVSDELPVYETTRAARPT